MARSENDHMLKWKEYLNAVSKRANVAGTGPVTLAFYVMPLFMWSDMLWWSLSWSVIVVIVWMPTVVLLSFRMKSISFFDSGPPSSECKIFSTPSDHQIFPIFSTTRWPPYKDHQKPSRYCPDNVWFGILTLADARTKCWKSLAC